ncbi:MAG: RluA family pseudouridine synthase [Deltaproteobacteria bacterium]
MQEYKLKAQAQDSGKRLDLFILDFAKSENLGLSRTAVQKLIREGKVTVANAGPLKSNRKIKSDDEITVSIEKTDEESLSAENIPLDVIYEDEDIAVINKPHGLVVHPAPGNYEHTLVNAILYRFKQLSDVNPQRPGIVHRLDKDTSGLLVIAKNNPAHLALAQQFSKHSIKRKYVALVRGRVELDEDIIDMPIGRHPYKRKSMSVGFGKNTRFARTHYRTLKRSDKFSLLELEPFTGRTHQLRVHLAFMGHPILGDPKYGKNDGFGRLALHAIYLGFMHPATGKPVEFECGLPEEFTQFLKKR